MENDKYIDLDGAMINSDHIVSFKKIGPFSHDNTFLGTNCYNI